MTKPRPKPKARFLAFIVEPTPEFAPNNWQQTPQHYRIVECMGPQPFKGSIDAWKFLHNHRALATDATRRWAIYLDFDHPIPDSIVPPERGQELVPVHTNK